MKIILASGSPRRREILTNMGFDVEVVPSAKETMPEEKLSPEDTVQFLAVEKGAHAKENYPDDVVVSADTVVVFGDEIMGKPKDREDAERMLKALSGGTHRVLTGYGIFYKGKSFSRVVSTEVEFYELTQKEIDWYLDTGEAFDKAGSYGVQGLGAYFVKGIVGDYLNVVGFPLSDFCHMLKKVL